MRDDAETIQERSLERLARLAGHKPPMSRAELLAALRNMSLAALARGHIVRTGYEEAREYDALIRRAEGEA